MSCIQVTFIVILNDVILFNNLLWNSYFENLTIELYVLYAFNIHVNWMLFTIRSINSSFMHYFKL